MNRGNEKGKKEVCELCGISYPARLVQPLIFVVNYEDEPDKKEVEWVCGICALKRIRELHKDDKRNFVTKEAITLLQDAKEFRKKLE